MSVAASNVEARRPWLLYAMVLCSGAAGLINEILWVRALGRHFGATAPAISAVLAAFMGGLALGSALLGGRADRHPRPIQLYGRIELGIALSAGLTSLLLLRGGAVLDALARLAHATGPAEVAARWLAATAMLLVPTTLMGGTLPVLARALARAGSRGRVVGSLYALNTVGAVFGTLLPDTALVPALGMTATAGVAVALNLGVGLVARSMAGLDEAPPPLTDLAAPRLLLPAAALSLTLVSGACSMAWEILWSRLVEHWASPKVVTFSAVLAVYLCAVAIGSWAARRLSDRVADPLAVAAGLLALAGPVAVAPVLLGEEWLRLAAPLLHVRGDELRPSLWRVLAEALLHAAWLQGLACLLLGAAFPFVAAGALRSADVAAGAAGRVVGRLFAANTLAGVVGSVLAAFVLLPTSGAWVSAWLPAAVLSAVAAAVGLERRSRAVALGGGLALAATLAAGALPERDPVHAATLHLGLGRVLELREGATTSAALVEHDYFGQPAWWELRTPGVSMSSTRQSARRYMGMMGHLGWLFAEEPSRALLICYGVGNTARSLLSHPDLERLDVVDISEEVLDLAPGFARAHGKDPLADARVAVWRDDGRHHLVVEEASYDLITMEPPPPTDAGVVNLYSREFYRLAARRLTPGGVLTQWLPVFEMSSEEVGASVSAFVAEFPHTALYVGYWYQWILVGSRQPLRLDPSAWEAAARQPSVAEDLRACAIEGAPELISAFLQGDAGLRASVEGILPLSDDLPLLQYPREALSGVPTQPKGMVGSPYGVSTLLAPGLGIDALLPYRPAVEGARRLVHALPMSGLSNPERRELLFGTAVYTAMTTGGPRSSALSLLNLDVDREGAARAALAGETGEPERSQARLLLGQLAFWSGRWAEALEHLDAADPGRVGPARHALLRGGALRALGRADEARAAFAVAAAVSGDPEFAALALDLARSAASPWEPAAGPLGAPE